MSNSSVSKFNANFINFLNDISDIIEDEGFRTMVKIINTANFLITPEFKINWFCSIMEKEYEISNGARKATLRDIYNFENYKLFINILLDEAKTVTSVEIPELNYENLNSDDKELIEEYVKAFVALSNNYLAEKKSD